METLGKPRGIKGDFEIVTFQDLCGNDCSLRVNSQTKNSNKSDHATVKLGRWPDQMSLDRKQVAALVGHLQKWLKTGEL